MWLFYAILSQLVVSIANFSDKLLIEKYIKDSATVFIFSGVVAFVLGTLIFILRGMPILPFSQIGIALAAGIFLQIYLLPYFKALKKDDTSRVLILFQLIPVFTLGISAVFLGEKLSFNQLAGFVVIFAGGLIISFKGSQKAKMSSATFWLMFISSLIYAISTILFKFVAGLQNLWDILAYEGLGMGLGVALALAYPNFFHRVVVEIKNLPIGGWLALGTSEVFYVLCRFLLAAALSLGPVALVNVMGGFQPVFLFIFGWTLTKYYPRLIKEEISANEIKRKTIALAAVFAGLYLIFT